MNEVCEFLKKVGVYYIATVEDGEPRVRPFGTVNIFENKLYIQTGKKKACFKQMDGKVAEICAFKDGTWLRLTGTLVNDDRVEPQEDMLNHYPELKGMYKVGDGNNAVLYFKNAKAVFYSFGKEPKTITF